MKSDLKSFAGEVSPGISTPLAVQAEQQEEGENQILQLRADGG